MPQDRIKIFVEEFGGALLLVGFVIIVYQGVPPEESISK